jgi:hypothetical protein
MVHHVNHEADYQLDLTIGLASDALSVESRRWQTLLLDGEPPVLDGCNDRLRQRLSILLLNHRLYILSVSLGCRRVVRLVLVQDHLIPSGTFSSALITRPARSS